MALETAAGRVGIAEPEPLGGSGLDAALDQVGAGLGARLASQRTAIVERSRLQDGEEPFTLLADAGVWPRVLLDGDAGPLPEEAQHIAKIEVVPLLHEGEDVAALVAAKAAPGSGVGPDVERASLLVVEGAQTLERLAGPLELHGLTDDVDDVQAALDLLDRRVGHGSPRGRCVTRAPRCMSPA